MKISVVLGTLFGDEGKGKTVSWLCSRNDHHEKVVVRFNGGHQAGHTVLFNGIKHTFSSFGSGTLQGVPTIWLDECTVEPVGLVNEYNALKGYGLSPQIYIEDLCPVTTPYDIVMNILYNPENLQHGTCGVGFGETLKRHESRHKLYFMDLFNDFVLRAKLSQMSNYCDQICKDFNHLDLVPAFDKFYKSVDVIRKENIGKSQIVSNYTNTHLIFEGAQGIMLDQDFGFFPNVTRSNTTCKNINKLVQNLSDEFSPCVPEIYYVARTYQTRHGAGPMSSEKSLNFLEEKRDEHNKSNEFQKEFRVGEYDQNLIDYAIKCNEQEVDFIHHKNLVFTCADHYPLPDLTKVEKDFHTIFISEGAESEIMRIHENG